MSSAPGTNKTHKGYCAEETSWFRDQAVPTTSLLALEKLKMLKTTRACPTYHTQWLAVTHEMSSEECFWLSWWSTCSKPNMLDQSAKVCTLSWQFFQLKFISRQQRKEICEVYPVHSAEQIASLASCSFSLFEKISQVWCYEFEVHLEDKQYR